MNLGTRGLACARDIVATAALRGAQIGHVQLAELHRSYSTGDVSMVGAGRIEQSRKRTIAEKRIEEEEHEEELETRTWEGTYDEHGRIVEYPVLPQGTVNN